MGPGFEPLSAHPIAARYLTWRFSFCLFIIAVVDLDKTNFGVQLPLLLCFITAAVGLKHLTEVRCNTKGTPDK